MVGRKMVPVVPRTTGQDERLLCQTWSDENERERERENKKPAIPMSMQTCVKASESAPNSRDFTN